MTEILTPEITFGRYIYGYGTDGTQKRKLIWISDVALSFDFSNSVYTVGGVSYTLTAVPGYSYIRSGAVSFVNAAGTVTDFIANVPPILSGIGYEAYDALTNYALRSQEFDNVTWTAENVTISANAVVAPDGTTTADTLTDTVTLGEHRVYQTLTAGNNYVHSVFAKAGTAGFISLSRGNTVDGFAIFDLTLGIIQNSTAVAAAIIPCANGWYRCVIYSPTSAASFIAVKMGTTAIDTSPSGGFLYAGTGKTVHLWQAQALLVPSASLSDGGPIITTAGTTASIGAQTLSVTIPNASYSAVYTFSDGTTQTIPTVIAGGIFTMPVYPTTLTKPAVASVRLT